MTEQLFSAWVVILAVSVAAVGAGPAPAPLRVSFALDRDTYLPYEPIFADCAVTNIGRTGLKLADLDEWLHLDFICTRSDGKVFRHENSGSGPRTLQLLNEPKGGVFPAGWSIRRCVDLQSFIGISEIGEYTLQAVHASKGYKIASGPPLEPVKSQILKFKIVAAEGEDAKAVKLIESAVVKGEPASLPANETLCRRMMDVRSARFAAAANFYGACQWFDGLVHSDGPNRGDPAETAAALKVARETVIEPLEACIAGPSSRYLKGIASCRLLLFRMIWDVKLTREAIRKEAERLAADYDGTIVAFRARTILDAINATKETPLREIAKSIDSN